MKIIQYNRLDVIIPIARYTKVFFADWAIGQEEKAFLDTLVTEDVSALGLSGNDQISITKVAIHRELFSLLCVL